MCTRVQCLWRPEESPDPLSGRWLSSTYCGCESPIQVLERAVYAHNYWAITPACHPVLKKLWRLKVTLCIEPLCLHVYIRSHVGIFCPCGRSHRQNLGSLLAWCNWRKSLDWVTGWTVVTYSLIHRLVCILKHPRNQERNVHCGVECCLEMQGSGRIFLSEIQIRYFG